VLKSTQNKRNLGLAVIKLALTELAVRKAAARDKVYTMADSHGLGLAVYPSGEKSWVFRYDVPSSDGKRHPKKKILGPYPLLSLSDARIRRDAARKTLLDGIDPFVKSGPGKGVFDELALEWWNQHKLTLKNTKNVQTMEHRIKAYIIPAFSGREPASIQPIELLDFIREIEKTGRIETAHRTANILSQIFGYIFAEKHLVPRNPILDIRGQIEPRKQIHHPSITKPEGVAVLRDKIKNYRGCASIRCAMLFSLYTFARPGEVRHCEWSEINWETSEWHIPAEKMKAGVKHIVPLSKQVLEILKEMKKHSFVYGKYVFPAERCYDGSKPYSDNTLNKAFVRQMGYPPQTVTAHGFRSTASTLLNESGLWNYDAIEHQLAHSGDDRVRKAYNYAEFIVERRRMMQWYADYVDELKAPEMQI